MYYRPYLLFKYKLKNWPGGPPGGPTGWFVIGPPKPPGGGYWPGGGW